MRIRPTLFCLLATFACLTSPGFGKLWAQDDAGQQGSSGGQSAASQEFDQLFVQWREKLDAMRKLQVEYKRALPAEQNGMEQQFAQLLTEATEMSVRLQSLVEEAYVANPADPDKEEFLISMAYAKYKQDKFEESLRLCKVLLNTQTDVRGGVLDLTAQNEYLLNNYDEAQRLIAEAETELNKVQRPLAAETQAMRTNLEADRAAWQEELAFQQADATPEGDPNALPRVELETTKGKIVIELFENEAPNTVANFITLVRNGTYNGTPFHRVIEGFMAQGGDPNGDGTGDAGYKIPFESNKEPYRKHFRAAVAMAHGPQSKDTGGTQFYIVYRRTGSRHLDGEHTVFGRVIEGMDAATDFARPAPGSRDPTIENPDRILTATVLNARDHEYTFRKVGDPVPEDTGNADGSADADSTGGGDSGSGDNSGSGDAGNGGDTTGGGGN